MADLDSLLAEMRNDYGPDPDARQRVRRGLASALAAGGVMLSSAGASGTLVSGAGSSAAAGTAAVGSGVMGAGAMGAGAAGAGVTAGGGQAGLGAGLVASKVAAPVGWTVAGKLAAGVGLVASLSVGVTAYRATNPTVHSAPASSVVVADVKPSEFAGDPHQAGKLEAAPGALALKEAPSAGADGADPTLDQSVREQTPEPASAARRTAHPGRAVVASAKPIVKDGSATLEDLRLLREASQALRQGDSARAQSLLNEHKERFPDSVVANERRGLGLLARCGSEPSASLRAEAERYLTQFPSSPVAESIRKQCLP
ncbi:MAG TPA: hypothetical protein VHM70_04590 [Polyangiaceae bacterium]|nr:hypothetical protein [Polyangiaceae bacterium]